MYGSKDATHTVARTSPQDKACRHSRGAATVYKHKDTIFFGIQEIIVYLYRIFIDYYVSAE